MQYKEDLLDKMAEAEAVERDVVRRPRQHLHVLEAHLGDGGRVGEVDWEEPEQVVEDGGR